MKQQKKQQKHTPESINRRRAYLLYLIHKKNKERLILKETRGNEERIKWLEATILGASEEEKTLKEEFMNLIF